MLCAAEEEGADGRGPPVRGRAGTRERGRGAADKRGQVAARERGGRGMEERAGGPRGSTGRNWPDRGGREGFSFPFFFLSNSFFSFSKVYLYTFIHSRYFLGAKNEMLGETTCVKCY
jgi:hypothetical protein